MSQFLVSPYWVCEHRARRDSIGRVYQVDHQFTTLRVTNPGPNEGSLDLVFWERRGDGNFYRSDWASGRWTAPPMWQRSYRPDPSRIFGDHFLVDGWFEVWMSLDEMLIDVAISGLTRSVLGDGAASGGVVASISQRTLPLVPRPLPWRYTITEWVLGPISPLVFPRGTRPILGDVWIPDSSWPAPGDPE